jgi:hypothetical protein
VKPVARAIHGDHYRGAKIKGNPLATDKTIDEVIKRNPGFVSAIEEHRSVLLRSLARKEVPPQRTSSRKGIGMTKQSR